MKKILGVLLSMHLVLSLFGGALAEDEIVIGLLHDLSGDMSVAGNATVFGAQYAIDKTNADGGINGCICH